MTDPLHPDGKCSCYGEGRCDADDASRHKLRVAICKVRIPPEVWTSAIRAAHCMSWNDAIDALWDEVDKP